MAEKYGPIEFLPIREFFSLELLSLLAPAQELLTVKNNDDVTIALLKPKSESGPLPKVFST